MVRLHNWEIESSVQLRLNELRSYQDLGKEDLARRERELKNAMDSLKVQSTQPRRQVRHGIMLLCMWNQDQHIDTSTPSG